MGWALRERQEFGKRGARKHMTEKVRNLLKTYFLSGNVDKKHRFTAATMLVDLEKRAEAGELEVEEIPKLKTIENWIARYSRQHKKESAVGALEISKNSLA